MIDDPRILAAHLIAASPLAMSIADAQAQARDRRKSLLQPPTGPEPDARPEPVPVVDAPEEFARDFWSKRRPPGPEDKPPKPKKPTGRRPRGDLGPQHDRFRVVPGGKDDGDKTK